MMVGTVKTWARLAACKECGTVKARPLKPHQRGERLRGYLHCSVCAQHTLQVDLGMELEVEVPVTELEHKKEVDRYCFSFYQEAEK